MIAALLISLVIQTGSAYDNTGVTAMPNAELVVAINPDQLVTGALTQSWNCIDEPFEGRQIRSKPLAKVKFNLSPLPSQDGASICVHAVGSSVGETFAAGPKVEVHSDSLSHFKIKQLAHLSMNDGLATTNPQISVNSNQSLIQAKSKSPLNSLFTSAAYRHFPERVKTKAEEFSRLQLTKRLDQSIQRTNEELLNQIQRLQSNQPGLASLDWRLSSDNRNVYLASGFGDYAASPLMNTDPIRISIHQGLATELVNKQWTRRTITSDQVKQWQQSNNFLSDRMIEDEKSWSFKFLERASDIKFSDNKLDIRLGFENFQSEGRKLSPFAVRIIYRLSTFNGQWKLTRDTDLEIRGKSAGARQKILRSVMEKRLMSLLPESLPIQLPPQQTTIFPGTDLGVSQISTLDEVLTILLRAK